MELVNKYRLRVQNCIGTIIDVNKTLSDEYENQEFISQLKELEQNIEDLDMSLVSERDILMIEQTTNALLREFRTIFKMGEFRCVFEQEKN